MKGIEIIRIRLAQNNKKETMAKIQELVSGLDQRGIKLYRHPSVESDMSLHLHFQSSNSKLAVSELGAHLVSILKGIGLVNHSIWIELEK